MNHFIEIRSLNLKPGTREDTLKSAASALKSAKADSLAVLRRLRFEPVGFTCAREGSPWRSEWQISEAYA